jgi:hypothetical protein
MKVILGDCSDIRVNLAEPTQLPTNSGKFASAIKAPVAERPSHRLRGAPSTMVASFQRKRRHDHHARIVSGARMNCEMGGHDLEGNRRSVPAIESVRVLHGVCGMIPVQ